MPFNKNSGGGFSIVRPQREIKSSNPPRCTGLDGVSTDTVVIPTQVVEYLKTSEKYANYYGANKKFAIYFTGANCPYAQAFQSAMEPIVNDVSYQQYYNFLARDANQTSEVFTVSGTSPGEPNQAAIQANNEINFRNLCHEFCIVNPVKNEIFYIKGVGEKEAAKIATVFFNLKNW